MPQASDPTLVVWSYGFYLVISVALTVWVAHTLHRNGRIFLVDAFGGREELADSVNHLLVVGFYLINIGYVALMLKYGQKPLNLPEAFEFLSTKVGMVLVVLGGMHFLNMYIFHRIHKNNELAEQGPPVQPDEYLNPAKA